MASLKDNIATVGRAAIAKRAEVEAAVMAKVIDARAARDACGKEVDLRKEHLAALEAKPIDSLPDEDAAIREHLMSVEVAKSRFKIAEKRFEAADAAFAQAQSELEADRTVQAPAFEQASLARERIAEDFDQEFPDHAQAIITLVESTIEVERQAARGNEKPTGVGRAVRAVRELITGSPTLRIELVDKGGAVLWRGDQSTTSATDTAR
jgi:hypothetical protein